jgi:hypothetical protein
VGVIVNCKLTVTSAVIALSIVNVQPIYKAYPGVAAIPFQANTQPVFIVIGIEGYDYAPHVFCGGGRNLAHFVAR